MTTESGIKRKLCRDLPREKGEAFEVWNKELLDAGHGEGDEDASWSDTFLGQDPRVGLTPAQTRRRAERNRKAASALLGVIPDTDLKAVIRSAAVNRPAGAPGLRTDATLAYNTLVAKQRVPQSSLRVQNKLDEFNAIRIRSHVGVSVDSLSKLDSKYTADNAELPAAVRFNADQITEKFLAAITFPAAIATHASQLLQSPTASLPPHLYQQPVAAAGAIPAVPGGWLRPAVVTEFDELWRAATIRNGSRRRNVMRAWANMFGRYAW